MLGRPPDVALTSGDLTPGPAPAGHPFWRIDTMEPRELKELLELLAEKAIDTDIAGADELRRLVDNHDLVFGVWNEALSESGVAYRIIKGEGTLDMINYTGLPQNVAWTAVRCRSEEEAFAIRETFGDKSRLV